MPVTEVVHHPLVANSAQERELYHKQSYANLDLHFSKADNLSKVKVNTEIFIVKLIFF